MATNAPALFSRRPVLSLNGYELTATDADCVITMLNVAARWRVDRLRRNALPPGCVPAPARPRAAVVVPNGLRQLP